MGRRSAFLSYRCAMARVAKPNRIAHAMDLRSGFQEALLAFLQSKTVSPSVPVGAAFSFLLSRSLPNSADCRWLFCED